MSKIIEICATGAVEGFYSFTKYNAATGEIVEKIDTVKNLITDRGLEMLKYSWTPYVFIGTGTTPPAVGDIELQSMSAHTNNRRSNWNSRSGAGGAPDYWVQGSGTWRFAAGVAVGNFTEIGIGNITSISPLKYELFSRALIVDSSGNPVTITVLPDEVLDVTYTVRVYSPVESFNNTVEISGISYEFTTSRFSYNVEGVDIYTGTGMPIAQYPLNVFNGTSATTFPEFNGDITATSPFTKYKDNVSLRDNSGAYVISYPSGEFSALGTFTAGLNDCNLDFGISGVSISLSGIHSAMYRAMVQPPIPKNATNILKFGFKWSWARR